MPRKPFGLMLGAGAIGALAVGLFAWLALRPEPMPSAQPAAAAALTQTAMATSTQAAIPTTQPDAAQATVPQPPGPEAPPLQ